MIITDKYIFVHVPKTGGQSVSKALGGKNQEVSTHTPLWAVEKGQRFAFGFVRNPWARMVSLYHFLCQKEFKKTDNFRQDEVRAAGFKRWLIEHEFYMQEDYLPVGECWVVGGKDTKSMLPMQQRPQMFWLNGCDYIGRFENLKQDFLLATAGLKVRQLTHMNKTKHEQYQTYYDTETRNFISEYFAEDIKKFGYQF